MVIEVSVKEPQEISVNVGETIVGNPDEDKELTKDGQNLTCCVDVESTDGWYEVETKKQANKAIIYQQKEE